MLDKNITDNEDLVSSPPLLHSSDAEGAGTRLMKTLMMITLPAVIPSSVTKKASTCRCSGDIGAENQQECQEQANG